MNDYLKKEFKNAFLEERYEKYTHPCGLDIYVFPKDMTSTYALFGVMYGSVNNKFITKDKKVVIYKLAFI